MQKLELLEKGQGNIPGFEENYFVTKDGEVWNINKKRFLKKEETYNGYYRVILRKDGKGKHYRVHRLVMFAYQGPCPEGYEVDHIDRNRKNNNFDNLRYVTRQENLKNRG